MKKLLIMGVPLLLFLVACQTSNVDQDLPAPPAPPVEGVGSEAQVEEGDLVGQGTYTQTGCGDVWAADYAIDECRTIDMELSGAVVQSRADEVRRADGSYYDLGIQNSPEVVFGVSDSRNILTIKIPKLSITKKIFLYEKGYYWNGGWSSGNTPNEITFTKPNGMDDASSFIDNQDVASKFLRLDNSPLQGNFAVETTLEVTPQMYERLDAQGNVERQWETGMIAVWACTCEDSATSANSCYDYRKWECNAKPTGNVMESTPGWSSGRWIMEMFRARRANIAVSPSIGGSSSTQ